MSSSAPKPIYLDNHATTPVDPRVVEAMVPYFLEHFGNAHSLTHRFGEQARDALEQSRTRLAELLGALPEEIVFTSGATEANNLAIRGVTEHSRCTRRSIVSVTSEHAAVLDPLKRCERNGFNVRLLEVHPFASPLCGQIDLNQLPDAITDDTALVSVMAANNEIGTLQPLREIGQLARERGALLHCDATQAVGKLDLNLSQLPIDLLSCSAHKFHGPKGIGLLWVRQGTPRVRLEPQLLGGGHELGRRSGTLNVPGVVGMARALELALEQREQVVAHLNSLTERLWKGLQQELGELAINGPPLAFQNQRLPGNLNVQLGSVDGASVMMQIPWVAFSSGAACSSIHPEPSHVLKAIGLDADQIRSSVRFGVSRFNTTEEIDRAVEAIGNAARKLNSLR